MNFGLDYFFVPQEVIDKRLSICKTCEHFDSEYKKCNKCGCYLDYKVKLRTVECPIGKWGKEGYNYGAS